MAFENLFVRSRKTLGGIQLDAVLSETTSSDIRTTSNPVEAGADITDHAIIEPKKIQILAEVSDTPLGLAAIGEIVDLITGLFGTSTSSNLTRSNAAYNGLVQIQEQREPISVQTGLKLYDNMLIKNITVTRDKDTSRIVRMNITMEEVRIVNTELVILSPTTLEANGPKEQASDPVSRGRVETVDPSANTQTSILKKIGGFF